KWILLIFSASALSFCFIIFTYLLYHYYDYDTEGCVGYITFMAVACGGYGIFWIVALLLNDGPTPIGEWFFALVFVLIYLVFVLFIIMKEILNTIGFSELQAVILNFIGVTVPLIIYMPIILHHPSLN